MVSTRRTKTKRENNNNNNNTNLITQHPIPRNRRFVLGTAPAHRAYDVHGLANMIMHGLHGPVNGNYGRPNLKHPHNPSARLTNDEKKRILAKAKATGWENPLLSPERKRLNRFTRDINQLIAQYRAEVTPNAPIAYKVQFFMQRLLSYYSEVKVSHEIVPAAPMHVIQYSVKLGTLKATISLQIFRDSVRVEVMSSLRGANIFVGSTIWGENTVAWFRADEAYYRFEHQHDDNKNITPAMKREILRDIKAMEALFPDKAAIQKLGSTIEQQWSFG